MANYEWVVLDADGTLFDYDRAETEALSAAFASFDACPDASALAVYREVNDRLWKAFERGEVTQERLRTQRFADLFAAIGLTLDPDRFSQTYLTHLARGTYLINDAEHVVRSLRSEVRLVLLTNGLADVQRPRLARSALRGLFDAVVISEEVGVAKPDGRVFDICFRHMGRPAKSSVLMVGDSLSSDIRGGIDYGIDTCWVNLDTHPPDPVRQPRFVIRQLTELLPIVLGDTSSDVG